MSAWGKHSALRSCDPLLSRVEENDETLVDLVILPIKSFGDDDVVRLASAIESNNNSGGGNLRTISASGHAVSPHSLELLGSAIGSCSHGATHTRSSNILSLSIGDQTMGDDGIIALCDGIMSKSTNEGATCMGLFYFINPTGLILASLAVVKVGFNKWLKFIMPLFIILIIFTLVVMTVTSYM